MNKKNIRRRVAWIMALVLVVGALCGCDSPAQKNRKDTLKLPEQITVVAEAKEIKGSPVAISAQDDSPVAAFSQQLMEQALKEARNMGAENVVLSPVSVYLALLVTASVESADQQASFEQVLSMPKQQWLTAGEQWMRQLNWEKEGAKVRASNSMWLDEGISMEQEVLDQLAEKLYTDVYQGDLQGEEIVEAINAWVDHKTEGMIQKFRQDPYNQAVMRSILNAVYMEGKWLDEFLPSDVREKIFYTVDGKEVTTDFLTDFLCRHRYIKTEEMDGVVLPYRDGNLAFVALRPTKGQGVDALLNSLGPSDWREISTGAIDTLMDFSMPKFTVEYQQTLTDVLADMGVSLQMGIGQKVKIQVDEEGTKAAAVTEVTAAGAIQVTEDPIQMHLDHPFVYSVIDLVTGVPLFVGVMDQPVQE